MTHSGIITGELCDTVSIHFERPNEKGFDFLDMDLPGEFVKKSFGFSEDEILTLKRYAYTHMQRAPNRFDYFNKI